MCECDWMWYTLLLWLSYITWWRGKGFADLIRSKIYWLWVNQKKGWLPFDGLDLIRGALSRDWGLPVGRDSRPKRHSWSWRSNVVERATWADGSKLLTGTERSLQTGAKEKAVTCALGQGQQVGWCLDFSLVRHRVKDPGTLCLDFWSVELWDI